MPDNTAQTPHNSSFGKLEPWEDVVICTDPPEETTEEGIYIGKDEGKDITKKPEKGIVYAVGKSSDPDKKLPFDLQAGDMIFFERYTANFISDRNVNYNFVRFKFIMGVKKKEEHGEKA